MCIALVLTKSRSKGWNAPAFTISHATVCIALFLTLSIMPIMSARVVASNILMKLKGLSNGGFISIFTSSIYPLFSMWVMIL